MDFTNLDSEETLKNALSWIAECIQNAMFAKEKVISFTFNPTEETNLEELFDFNLKLKEEISRYHFQSWCILDNKRNKVTMKVFI